MQLFYFIFFSCLRQTNAMEFQRNVIDVTENNDGGKNENVIDVDGGNDEGENIENATCTMNTL